MADVSVTNTFADATTAEASEVNTNFNDLVAWINSNAIRKDGTVAFTSVPTGPATMPTSDNHLVRKAYVDQYAIPTLLHTEFGDDTQPSSENIVANSTTTITDPGYDIELWGVAMIKVTPATTLDISNMWEARIKVDGTTQGKFNIPVVQTGQSLAVVLPKTVKSTGSNTTLQVYTARTGGSQSSLTIAANGTESFMDIWYRRK